jgi:DNA invertase Pin-like site-specific DNA recombinase
MLGKLAPGDVVTVTRIDRLARSTFDLFAIVKQIVDGKAQFRSLAEPWADTGTSTGRLMIAVLGGLADVELDLIRARTAEGRSRAKAQGQHMGRPPSLTSAQQKEATRRRAQGATLQELADNYDRSISTMRRASSNKYETAINRVSLSVLFRFARRLNVPVAYFFDGLPPTTTGHPNTGLAEIELHSRLTRDIDDDR